MSTPVKSLMPSGPFRRTARHLRRLSAVAGLWKLTAGRQIGGMTAFGKCCRANRIGWAQYFTGINALAAEASRAGRSQDPKRL